MKNNWPIKKLGDALENAPSSAKLKKKDILSFGKFPVIDQSQNFIAGYSNDEENLYPGDLPVIVFGDHTLAIKFVDFPFVRGADGTQILKPKRSLNESFLYYQLLANPLQSRGYSRHFSQLKKIQIKIPPLEVQKKIVKRLDAIKKAQELNDLQISKTDEFFESTAAEFLAEDWTLKPIQDVSDVESGGTPDTKKSEYWNGNILWLTPKELSNNCEQYTTGTERKITEEGLRNSSAKLMPVGTVLLTSRAPIGYVTIAGKEIATNQGFKNIICKDDILNNQFFYYWIKTHVGYLQSFGHGATFKEISKTDIQRIEIPVPPLSEQQKNRHQTQRNSGLQKTPP